eukprot:4544217-Amphidinium_carterae.2
MFGLGGTIPGFYADLSVMIFKSRDRITPTLPLLTSKRRHQGLGAIQLPNTPKHSRLKKWPLANTRLFTPTDLNY